MSGANGIIHQYVEMSGDNVPSRRQNADHSASGIITISAKSISRRLATRGNFSSAHIFNNFEKIILFICYCALPAL